MAAELQVRRYEEKYLLSPAHAAALRELLDGVLPRDRYSAGGAYYIRSLYFDDYDNRCYWENENGTDPREKFRIRIYNGSTDRIRLECKRKERGKTLKSSCPLTLEQTQLLMAGKVLPHMECQPAVLQKLTREMLLSRMRPVVIVEYYRIPYVYKNGNVRITLDTQISACDDIQSFLNPSILKRPVMPLGQQLLEVKYDAYLPDFIYRSLQLENLRQTAFSKYYICRKIMR